MVELAKERRYILDGLSLENFTAFKILNLNFCDGINVLIGANSTGKTHLMKAAYSALSVAGRRENFAEKLLANFMPMGMRIGRLVHRQKGSSSCKITVTRPGSWIEVKFTNHTTNFEQASLRLSRRWRMIQSNCAFIPAKEMLAHAPGFRSLYADRQIHFEEIYADLIDRAYRPILRGPLDEKRRRLLEKIRRNIDGKISQRDETFFLRNRQGMLEFSLLAEGLRKLGLIWLLVQNGTLTEGAVLFWDEPEANLNPRAMRDVADILIELQRMGVQIFLATHDFVLLKELDLRREESDILRYFVFYRATETKEIVVDEADTHRDIDHNAISDTFADLYDREIDRALKQNIDKSRPKAQRRVQ